MAQVAARLVHAQEVEGASPSSAMIPKLKGERLFVKQREVGSSPTGVAIEHGFFIWEPTPFTWMFETRPYLGWYGVVISSWPNGLGTRLLSGFMQVRFLPRRLYWERSLTVKPTIVARQFAGSIPRVPSISLQFHER